VGLRAAAAAFPNCAAHKLRNVSVFARDRDLRGLPARDPGGFRLICADWLRRIESVFRIWANVFGQASRSHFFVSSGIPLTGKRNEIRAVHFRNVSE